MTPADTPAAQAAAGDDVWRVVLADASVRVFTLHTTADGQAWASCDTATGWVTPSPRMAVVTLCSSMGLDVAEVLAPGEVSRAPLTANLARLRAPLAGDLAAIEARAVSQAAALDALRAEAREHGDDSYGYGICRVLSVLPRGVDPDVTALLARTAAHAAALDAAVAAARAEALREAAAAEAGDLAARDAAMRGTLAAPSLATMRALHRAGGCWLVSYDDDDSGDPVTTVEHFDGARALAEKEGDNPVRWVAVDRCGRVCLPPQGDDADGAL